MRIWTHSLKFNVGTGGIHQLPQTTGDGIHNLLQEVVWDVGDNVPNVIFQLFHCARFCPVHLLCSTPQEKVTGCEIWASCRPFVKVLFVAANVPETSDPTRHLRPVQSVVVRHRAWKQIHRCFPARYDTPHVIFQRLKIAFGIHGVTQKIWADHPSGRHSASYGHFWTILHLLHRHFGIVYCPVIAIMSIDETADMENGLIAPGNVFKEFWPILVPTQHQHPIFHSAVTLQVSAPERNGVSAGENSSISLTPYVPCASTVHFREQLDVLIYAGCGWTYPAPTPRSQIGMWMDGHFFVRP